MLEPNLQSQTQRLDFLTSPRAPRHGCALKPLRPPELEPSGWGLVICIFKTIPRVILMQSVYGTMFGNHSTRIYGITRASL